MLPGLAFELWLLPDMEFVLSPPGCSEFSSGASSPVAQPTDALVRDAIKIVNRQRRIECIVLLGE